MDWDSQRIKSVLTRAKKHGNLLLSEQPLGRTVTERQLKQAEHEIGVAIPEALRDFYLQVANGAPGPAYGIYRLSEIVANSRNPASDFRHRNRWRNGPLDRKIERLLEKADHDLPFDKSELDRLLGERDSQLGGMLQICDSGCALFYNVVATGPFAGDVWYDGCADDAGIVPLTVLKSRRPRDNPWYRLGGQAKRMSFKDWYMGWVELVETYLR